MGEASVLEHFGISLSSQQKTALFPAPSEADAYLRAKFGPAPAAVAAGSKKGKSGGKHKKKRASEAEQLDNDELELLGLQAKAEPATPSASTSSTHCVALATEQAPSAAGICSTPAPDDDLRLVAGHERPATRLASPGTEQTTQRFCDQGHPLACYMVGCESCGICDCCDRMQREGQVLFGCKVCEFELCGKCALDGVSPTDAERDMQVISQATGRSLEDVASDYSRRHRRPPAQLTERGGETGGERGGEKRGAGSSGSLLDPAALGSSSTAPEDSALAPTSLLSSSISPSKQKLTTSASPRLVQCSAEKCEEALRWTRQCRDFAFHCVLCGRLDKGARFRCSVHGEDFCKSCAPTPEGDRTARDWAKDIDEMLPS